MTMTTLWIADHGRQPGRHGDANDTSCKQEWGEFLLERWLQDVGYKYEATLTMNNDILSRILINITILASSWWVDHPCQGLMIFFQGEEGGSSGARNVGGDESVDSLLAAWNTSPACCARCQRLLDEHGGCSRRRPWLAAQEESTSVLVSDLSRWRASPVAGILAGNIPEVSRTQRRGCCGRGPAAAASSQAFPRLCPALHI